VTLQQLLDAVPCTAVDFFEPFKRFCRALGLQPTVVDLVLLLERKYVVSHLLFRKYEKLFALYRQRTDSSAFRFGWLLFLVAKSRVLRYKCNRVSFPTTLPHCGAASFAAMCRILSKPYTS
jgi:hypothetical protein